MENSKLNQIVNMPKKRKNSGKNRHNRGRVGFVRCDVSGRAVPKDKAVKRFIVRNLVDPSGQKDLKDASYYDKYIVPKMYYKACYCISAAIHQRIGIYQLVLCSQQNMKSIIMDTININSSRI